MHLLPTIRTGFILVSSRQVLGLPWAPRGASLLVLINHVSHILLASDCFKNKHMMEFWPMR